MQLAATIMGQDLKIKLLVLVCNLSKVAVQQLTQVLSVARVQHRHLIRKPASSNGNFSKSCGT